MNQIKRIGVLTSGGDCAGLNAIISAVVEAAEKKGWEVYGINDGTEGITEKPHRYEVLTVKNFSDTPWPRLSGSYLGSLNKGLRIESLEDVSKRFAIGVKELGLDAIVVIGGDGSMNIVSNMSKGSLVKIVGIPKTIDNDTPITEFSVGFQTAVQYCTTSIDSLELTARSHNRAMITEVMGRDAGHLALHSALAGKADVCLIPEIPYTIDGIIKKLKEIKARGRNHAVIVVSEGIRTENGDMVSSNKNMVGEAVYGGIGQYLCSEISKRYNDFQFRVTTLGHLQRSGVPVAFDRLLAATFGAKAVELLAAGEDNKMVIWKDGEVSAASLPEVVKAGTTLVDTEGKYVKAAKDLGMYIGEI
ncbi:MAG: ATP-dependent 6-phosphofructokinase [Alphaproteobacteria bacterium]|nr:ATP-dependent 6-phosphofructokinase [Alphaproteobacteria bacterium]